MDVVLCDALNDELHGLSAVTIKERDRLIQVDVLFLELRIVDVQMQVGKLLFRVGLAQLNGNRAGRVELLRFVDLTLVVVAVAFALEHHELLADGPCDSGGASVRFEPVRRRSERRRRRYPRQ